jgi:hypothetical protein
MTMTTRRREVALDHLAHVQATAHQLRELLTKIADVRAENGWSDTWQAELERARELLGKALAHVTRYAVT